MASNYSNTTFVTTQPPSYKINPFQNLNNNWNVGLWDCCNDVSGCCYAYWCWSCFLCSLAGKLNESKCSCCCVPNALGVYRMKARSVLHIEGDSCNDYCVTACCPCCAALQMHNELRFRSLG